MRAIGIEPVERLGDAVGARRVVHAGHDRAAACGLDRGDDLRRIGSDRDLADIGLHGAAPDLDDHGRAGDVRERLSGKACRAHTGGDKDQS